MDYEGNPGKRRRKRKKSGSAPKRRRHKRANPAPKRARARRRHRRNPVAARPNPPKRRRRRRSNPSMRARRVGGRRRHRRNPSMGSFLTIMKSGAVGAIGGGLAYGSVWAASKIPVTNVYGRMAIIAAAPLAIAVPAAAIGMERISVGAMGGFGFQLPTVIIAAYNHYKATQAAPQKKTGEQPGTKGLWVGAPRDAGTPATARVGLRNG